MFYTFIAWVYDAGNLVLHILGFHSIFACLVEFFMCRPVDDDIFENCIFPKLDCKSF